MATTKIAVTIDADLLRRVDHLVAQRRYPNRSRAVQQALQQEVDRETGDRLARECAKLDRAAEQRLADEGFEEDIKEWPAY